MTTQPVSGTGRPGFFQRVVFLFIAVASSLFVTFLWVMYSGAVLNSFLALDFDVASLRIYFAWFAGGASIILLAALTSRFVFQSLLPRKQWLVLAGLASGMLAFVLLLGDQFLELQSWSQGFTWLMLGPVLPYLMLVYFVRRGGIQ